MTDARTFVLHGPRQSASLLEHLRAYAGEAAREGRPLEVEVRPARRNSGQNALLHAALTTIAGAVEWAGKRRDVETWKRLLTAAWLRARGTPLEILPAIDGKGIDVVYVPTSKLSRADFAELIDYIDAWAAEQGLDVSSPYLEPA